MKVTAEILSYFKGSVLKKLVKILFTLGLISLNSFSWERPYYFIQMADTQIPWNTGGYVSEDLFKIAVEKANALQPEFVIICGDLLNIDGNNFDLAQATDYLNRYNAIAKDFNVPVKNVPGNHDVLNTPNSQSLDWYKNNFGDYWYSFEHLNNLFIVLESDVLKNPGGAPGQDSLQMEWLKAVFDSAKTKNYYSIMTFMHHPMAFNTVDEAEVYFNMGLVRRQELLQLYHDHGVIASFSGHYHRNAYLKDGNLELITTSATGVQLGSDEPGFRIVKIQGPVMEHEYYTYDQLPAFIESDVPSLTVTSPNGGENIIEGTKTNITWNSLSMAPNIKIEFTDGSGSWTIISDSTSNSGSYEWDIPYGVSSPTVKIRLTTLTSNISDESDEDFFLRPGGIPVIEKNFQTSHFPFLLFGKEINFSCNCSDVSSINITDIHGRLVKAFDGDSDELTWTGHNESGTLVPQGLYLLTVHGLNGSQTHLLPNFH